MQISGLLVHNFSGDGRSIKHRKVCMPCYLSDRFGFGVERKNIEFAVAVRTEINSVTDPHWVNIVAACFWIGANICAQLRDLFNASVSRGK